MRIEIDTDELAKIIVKLERNGSDNGSGFSSYELKIQLADYFEKEDKCKECLVKHYKGKTSLSCYNFKGNFNKKQFLKKIGVENE